MSDGRKSIKARQPTGDRFERFARDDESQTDTLARLLDEAGVPEVLRCAECGSAVSDFVTVGDDRTVYCLDCVGVDPDEVPSETS